MSIKINGTFEFLADGGGGILAGQTAAGISFWVRSDAVVSARVLGCKDDARFFVYIQTSPSFRLVIEWAGPGGLAQWYIPLTPNASTHIVASWASGAQAAYKNGVLFTPDTQPTGATDSSLRLWELGSTPYTGQFTVHDVAVWHGYAPTQADALSIRNGTSPQAISNPCTLRWTLAGTTGATPAIGNAGLNEAHGLTTWNFTSFDGTGTAVYADPLSYTIPTHVASARVGTSGRTVFLFPTAVSDGSWQQISVSTTPTLSVNSVSKGPLVNLWNTQAHKCIGYQTPSGVTIAPGDSVTLDAPAAWASGPNGEVALISSLTVENRAGTFNTFNPTDAKTLKMGVNFPHSGCVYYTLYNVFKDWRQRLPDLHSPNVGGTPCTRDLDGSQTGIPGYPVQLAGPVASHWICGTPTGNGIDGAGYGGPIGLFAVQWDDPNGTDSFALFTDSWDTTVVTERTDLANPGGAGGVGKCRVFDVQRAPGATSEARSISLQITTSDPSHRPSFRNLHVYGPQDFTPRATAQGGTTLDVSDPYAVSNVLLSRFTGGLGSARFIDSSAVNFGGPNPVTEPEDIRGLGDFDWNYDHYASGLSFSQARPFVFGSSAFIYAHWLGSPYPVSVASPPSGTTGTSLTVTVDSTHPVLRGLILSDGGEKMRVISVSSDGATVTVERGSLYTTKTTHSAGTWQCSSRLALPTAASAGRGYAVAEYVTTTPHNLTTMSIMASSDTFPQIGYYSNGVLLQAENWMLAGARPVLVTGPSTFLIFITNTLGSVVETIDQTYSLTGCSSGFGVPGSPHFPYEATAKIVAAFPNCKLHVGLPIGCSDALADEIARRILAVLPSGRQVWLELANEPWNNSGSWYFTFNYFGVLSNILYPGLAAGIGPDSPYPYLVFRSGQLRDRIQAIFAAAGRGNEIKLGLNCTALFAGSSQYALQAADALGVSIDAIMCAPYQQADYGSPSSLAAYHSWDVDQCIDLWVHDGWYGVLNPYAYGPQLAQIQANIAWYNGRGTGRNCILYSYEGVLETGCPGSSTTLAGALNSSSTATSVAAGGAAAAGIVPNSYWVVDSEWLLVTGVSGDALTVQRGVNGTTAASHSSGATLSYATNLHRTRDMKYHPNWYFAEQDFYAFAQSNGFKQFNVYGYDMIYYGVAAWGIYSGFFQQPGRGDGSDGKSDNRLCLATPGQTHSKSGTTSLDAKNVSVRGQAFTDWNRNWGAIYKRRFGPAS